MENKKKTKNKKRFTWVNLAQPLTVAALLLWTVPASAAPETTLNVAVGDPEDSEMGVVGHAFKKYVEE